MGFSNSNVRGAVFMMASMAAFVLNDTLVKILLADMNMFQVIFARGAFVGVFLFLLAMQQKALPPKIGYKRTIMHPAFVLRTIGEVCATFFFITALAHMPIANITAVLQVLPLTITLGAALVLKETIGWRRYIAIGIGFLGVLLIIRPGTEGFNIYALSALAATFFVTLRDLATRKLPSDTSSVFTSLCTGFSIFLFGAMGCLFYEWSAINNLQLVLLACAGVILAAAYLLSVLAVREGDMGFVSPFRYSILIWALLLGYFVFGDIPDTLALFGAALVVGSGLFTFYRERLLK